MPPIVFAVTMGEPAGIGGEIALAAWLQRTALDLPPFMMLDDPDRLKILASQLHLDIPVAIAQSPTDAEAQFSDALPVLPLDQSVTATPGTPSRETAPAVLTAIEKAVHLCQSGSVSGMVTNPIHKGVLYETGFRHPDHTEYLAELAGVDRTVMMLVGGGLRTVPTTLHSSLRNALAALSEDLIVDTCRIVSREMAQWFGLPAPRLAVSSLNPHAGEGGALGEEEIRIIGPALARLRNDGITVSGPLPADTMFHADARMRYDVAVCMYHDQALIPVKALNFHGGVNVTLGLPFIRTSPDHGIAFDLAGTGTARPDSLIAALRLAAEMAQRRWT